MPGLFDSVCITLRCTEQPENQCSSELANLRLVFRASAQECRQIFGATEEAFLAVNHFYYST